MADNLTTTSPLPDDVLKWGKCLLLHKKIPVMTENGIKYICKECKNDNDTSKDQRITKSS
jgi:hypothetical protein